MTETSMDCKFSKNLQTALEKENLIELSQLYAELSEEENIVKAKSLCLTLYKNVWKDIIASIKERNGTLYVRYYAWHILQLMTSCDQVKNLVQKDFTLLPLLMDIVAMEWDDLQHSESLQIISLNYLISMLGGADNAYYDHVVCCGSLSFIRNVLQQSSLTSTDPMIESVILLLNLLLEGTDLCKKKVLELDFSNLLSRKIRDRNNCEEALFKVATMTHQKMLLLTSESQAFVETFRKEFNKEAQKQTVYQSITCFNMKCEHGDNNENVVIYKRCSRCKIARYCSKSCQLMHWKGGHSKECKPP